jgi:hypothetical protein
VGWTWKFLEGWKKVCAAGRDVRWILPAAPSRPLHDDSSPVEISVICPQSELALNAGDESRVSAI